MNIYLDTNLWNELHDGAVDPESLLASLAASNSGLVLSRQNVCELAKCFRTEGLAERGKALCAYLLEFLRRDILYTNEIMEVLSAEMWALRLGTPANTFVGPEGHRKLTNEVEKLANGDFGEHAKEFVDQSAAMAAQARSAQAAHLDQRPELRQRLKRVAAQDLKGWMRTETVLVQGVALLVGHIRRQFPEAHPLEALLFATRLLESPACRLAKALVGADLYYNWRCANRGSNRKDLVDDMYHVLNAIYCDAYATKERGHAEYAGMLLTAETRVAIYDGQQPVGKWIEALAQTAEQR